MIIILNHPMDTDYILATISAEGRSWTETIDFPREASEETMMGIAMAHILGLEKAGWSEELVEMDELRMRTIQQDIDEFYENNFHLDGTDPEEIIEGEMNDE